MKETSQIEFYQEVKMFINQLKEVNSVNVQNAKLSGMLLLASILSVVICLALIIPHNLALDPINISSTFDTINQYSRFHILELVFDEITNILTILMAGALFLAFRDTGPSRSLSASLLIASGGIVMLIHDMGNFAITWLAKMHESAGSSEQLILQKIGYSVILTAKWGVTIGAACIVAGVLIYIMLWISTKTMSKALGYLGIFCGILALFSFVPYWIDFSLESLGYNLYFPFMIWEIVAGIWLVRFKGMKASGE